MKTHKNNIIDKRILAISLENLFLRSENITDGLTGLYNRRYFDKRVTEEVERAKRYHRPVSLLMIDIDHFKNFNDTYGHRVGDEILKATALTIKRNIRKVDLLFRYGGEEFACLLPDTNESGALNVAGRLKQHIESTINVADRIRKMVKDFPFSYEEKRLAITVSIGAGSFQGRNPQFRYEGLIANADSALYRAKQLGRDRIEVAARQQNIRLMIVDDEAFVCQTLSKFFTQKGYQVLTAMSGNEALSLIAKEHPHILFLDIKMPGISGIDVLRQSTQSLSSTKVIMLTSCKDEEYRQTATALGASGYITKPFSLEYLDRDVMARLLELLS